MLCARKVAFLKSGYMHIMHMYVANNVLHLVQF